MMDFWIISFFKRPCKLHRMIYFKRNWVEDRRQQNWAAAAEKWTTGLFYGEDKAHFGCYTSTFVGCLNKIWNEREQIRSARYNYLIPISEIFLVQQTGWTIVWSPSVCVYKLTFNYILAPISLWTGNTMPFQWWPHGNLHSAHEVSSKPTSLELSLLDLLKNIFS